LSGDDKDLFEKGQEKMNIYGFFAGPFARLIHVGLFVGVIWFVISLLNDYGVFYFLP
jgi:hypothetical protein